MRIRFLVLGIVLLVACSPTQSPTPVSTYTPFAPTGPPAAVSTSTPLPPAESPTPPGSTATSKAAYGPVFEPARCFTADLRASMPDSGYDLTCGYLVVPEDRSQPEGRQAKLPVVVFHTQNPDPKPDPVIYLAGGGG